MQMISKLFLIALSLLPWSGVRAEEQAASPSPKSAVQVTIEQLVEAVEANPGDAALKARRTRLREIINPRFDFEEMAKRSLGTYWLTATPEQQKEFVSVFSNLLARTYLSKVESIQRDTVVIDSERIEYPKALVKTTVRHKGDTFPIDYKLVNQNGAWRVYDVLIENIGLVANYRNEFSGIIRKEKIEGLLIKLREKNEAQS